MTLRHLLLPGSALLFLTLSNPFALSQTPLTWREKPSTVFNGVAQRPPCPPPPPGMPPKGGVPPEPPWAQAVNLSTDQRSRLQVIHEQTKTAIDALQQQLFQAHNQMRSLLESDASIERLQQQHQMIQALHQQIESKHFATILEERRVLTPEQRNRLTQWLKQSWQPPFP